MSPLFRLVANYLVSIFFRNNPDYRELTTRMRYGSATCHVQDDEAAFRFAAELLQCRINLIQKLTEDGFEWFTGYKSIDIDHELYGLEVRGIDHLQAAKAILQVMSDLHPDWKYWSICRKEYGADTGLMISLHRDPEIQPPQVNLIDE